MRIKFLLIVIICTLLGACGHSSETLQIPVLPDSIDGTFILDVPPAVEETGDATATPAPSDETDSVGDEEIAVRDESPYVKIDPFASNGGFASQTYVPDEDRRDLPGYVVYDASDFVQYAENVEETEESSAEDTDEVDAVPAGDDPVIITDYDFSLQRDDIKLPAQCKKHPDLCKPRIFYNY